MTTKVGSGDKGKYYIRKEMITESLVTVLTVVGEGVGGWIRKEQKRHQIITERQNDPNN